MKAGMQPGGFRTNGDQRGNDGNDGNDGKPGQQGNGNHPQPGFFGRIGNFFKGIFGF